MGLNKSELVGWMKLTRVPRLGPQKLIKLFNLFKELNAVLNASSDDLFRTRIFSKERQYTGVAVEMEQK